MNPLHKFRAFLFRKKFERDMADEMRMHLEMKARSVAEDGASPDEARYAARRAFGGEEQIKEVAREQRTWVWLEQTGQGFGYALRSLRKNPAFSLAAVLTLALGIGATTAIFTIVDTMLWRPLPYANPERLVYSPRPFTGLTLRAWAEAQSVLERVETHAPDTKVFTGGGAEASNVLVDAVSPGVFEMLGRTPALGRPFSADDAEVGNEPTAILTDGFWRRQFGGDAGVLGRKVVLNDQPYTVVGVMPRGFAFSNPKTEIWVPLTRAVTDAQLRQRIEIVGKLRPGVEFEAARRAVTALNKQLNRSHPQPSEWQIELFTLNGTRANPGPRKMLVLVLGAVGFVLLIACSNVANLLLTRAAVRQREFSVRVALGAGRGRLFRQVLTESLVLAVAGAVGGLLFAQWAVKALWLMAPYELTFLTINEVSLNWRALGFTAGLIGLAAVLCGVVPAWRAALAHGTPALGAGTRSATGSRSQHRWQEGLVIAQAALAFVLLVGAGLLIRGFVRLSAVNPGFEMKNLAALSLQLPGQRYTSAASRENFFKELRERIAAVPGVAEAAFATGIPPRGGGISFGSALEVEGHAPQKLGATELLPFNSVDENYFRVMRIPLVRGRGFEAQDVKGAPPAIVINEPMARRFWPDGDPIGQRIRFNPRQPWMTVVGIAGDVKARTLDDENGNLEYYTSSQQDGYGGYGTLAVRTEADPSAMMPALRKAVAAMDSKLPIVSLTTAEDLMAETLAVSRFSLMLMALFAGAAILLAAIGLYGVMSYAVVQRTPEIGIRMALGGTVRDIVFFVARRGLLLTSVGLVIGVGVAAGLTRYLGSMLFEISALDPLTFGGMAVLLGVVGALACWLPARRAAKVDPMVALRAE